MRSILIVEDSSTVREMVTFVLKDERLKIVEAEDGLEALDLAKKQNFDLVITDHNMPNMKGIDLAIALRNMESYKETPILMLTTESDPRLKKVGKDTGITGWILKPLSPQRFKPAIEKLLDIA
ncbi:MULTISPECIES: response regulator [unclassified Oleiphilus]|jgi:two-component system chemotaxis response regulator CheY|uniref:response regulator n=1 Tax=unclassified Oleiphilus TaxID=2631174 RepID=UPI0007C36CDC|nr:MULTISPECIES: response regulator [unclassified Oleiphilus]KZY40886.1 Fis family transcriptional regulator [Oleiphilus sp. HI0050]KZY73707.1 Fis family transcriptional regulator [Oleiphilus sp. HI0068]KZY78776.1 Fis family transcriptional regulator [Oleiphilus sp. HI0069]KZY90060.1 Fis family transcriptional regulator [Oleiphilus sp. HI0072]KZZ19737.1 Fis family transcriptional regulator [Oleiphilus sp. HI0081]KZZ21142.1 Fis family transcriptional regulator [Oleiphilus sp. HI0078]KZZ37242.